MLEMCRRDQWSVRDLDLSKPPRPMSEADEASVVQLFTDMALIERLAGALFVEQERRVRHPTLKAIFGTFVTDEVRHSHAAQLLADHYDRRKLRVYRPSPGLLRFFPPFLEAIRCLDDDVANAYITGGELILDIALLRSIDDFVDDDASKAAMKLINRDESRHIAIDFHMVEYYCSPDYRAAKARAPKPSLRQRAHAARTFTAMMFHAREFLEQVFFKPMDLVDPTGRRMKEAFKRMQVVGKMPGSDELPFTKFVATFQELHDHPVFGRVMAPVAQRVIGVDSRYMRKLFTDADVAHARSVGFEGLAKEAVAVKYGPEA